MEIQFNPWLAAIAAVAETLFPAGNGRAEVLRLQVDYKSPDGVDRNTDLLVNAPQRMTTARLIEVVRESLRPGCTLSAIGSMDYNRPIYIAPGFLEESMAEQGLPIPADVESAMDICGLKLLTLEEIRQLREVTANE